MKQEDEISKRKKVNRNSPRDDMDGSKNQVGIFNQVEGYVIFAPCFRNYLKQSLKFFSKTQLWIYLNVQKVSPLKHIWISIYHTYLFLNLETTTLSIACSQE